MNSEEYDKLSDEEKRIKIAELCGYKAQEGRVDGLGRPFLRLGETGRYLHISEIPDYLNDLNACHEFEELIVGDVEKELRYLGHLNEATRDNKLGMFRATAEQRCKAFVLTMEAE